MKVTKRLKDLVSDIPYRLIAGDMELPAGDIVWNSRLVKRGDIFVAVIGGTQDAHKYIPNAISSGAAAIVTDKSQTMYDDAALSSLVSGKPCTVIEIEDTRAGLAQLSSALYSHPEKDISLFGITGTKGKTTTAFMLHKMLQENDHKAGLMGTVFNLIGDTRMKTDHTTPEAPVTYEFLGMLRGKGFDSCVMEVSSLGLKLGRNLGMRYKVCSFTNLYKDHVGGIEHPDMDDYYNSKLMIFDNADCGVINIDSDRSDRTVEYASSRCKVFTYSIDRADADVTAKNIRPYVKDGISGTMFDMVYGDLVKEVFVPIPGKFNVYNALCALSSSICFGLDIDKSIEALGNVRVPGRLQPVENKLGAHILVDYAHNGEALSNVIKTAREFTKGNVITLFGCGGDRPKERRYEMGKVAAKMSDITIITSDNPRTENPGDIIKDILSVMDDAEGEVNVISDRHKAIRKAVEIAEEGDTVLIAGKGHEDYQDVMGVKLPFDDYKEAVNAVREEEAARGIR